VIGKQDSNWSGRNGAIGMLAIDVVRTYARTHARTHAEGL